MLLGAVFSFSCGTAAFDCGVLRSKEHQFFFLFISSYYHYYFYLCILYCSLFCFRCFSFFFFG